jgi:hypothetical protein
MQGTACTGQRAQVVRTFSPAPDARRLVHVEMLEGRPFKGCIRTTPLTLQ